MKKILFVILLLLLSCSQKHPMVGDKYINNFTREIVTIEKFLLDKKESYIITMRISDKDTLRDFYSTHDFDSLYSIVTPETKLHPAKDDWYENIKTRERVKIASFGNGNEILKREYDFKAERERDPDSKKFGQHYIVSLKSDSLLISQSFCIVLNEVNSYPDERQFYRLSINIYSNIYAESDFERNFVFIH